MLPPSLILFWLLLFYRKNAGAPIAVEGRNLQSPTFWEFARWIIDGGGSSWYFAITRCQIFPGIFDTACQKKGFLWCLLQMIFLGEMDRHWNPYYIHCNLCHTKYTAVIKWEIVCWYFEEINYKRTRYEVYCDYKVRGFASWYLKESNNRMPRTGLNIWTRRRKCSSLG